MSKSSSHWNLDERVAFLRKALCRMNTCQHPGRFFLMGSLSKALSARFEQFGRFADLDEAIQILHDAIASQGAQPYRPYLLHTLASALHIRFDQRGQLPDIEKSIGLLDEVLTSSYPDRLGVINSLAGILGTRFEAKGDLYDLDKSIALFREGIGFQDTSHPDYPCLVNNLGHSLRVRFKHTARLVDLDEAISLHRKSLDFRGKSHPERSSSLNNLASALRSRFWHTRQLEDLDQAISCHREALELREEMHPGRVSSLNNIATALRARHWMTGRFEDLEESILWYREAISLVAHLGHPNKHNTLINFSYALQARFGQTRQICDMEESILLSQQALQVVPADHPHRCKILTRCGEALGMRFVHVFSREPGGVVRRIETSLALLRDMTMATLAFRDAARCESAPVSERYHAARQWIWLSDLRSAENEESLDAYQTAIGLLPRLVMLGLNLEARQKALTASNINGLPRDAAVCAIRYKKFDLAIELLESGRGVFWSQALQLRTPLDDLESVEPELAHKLKDISRKLEHGALRDDSRTMLDHPEKVISMERETTQFRRLNDEWLEIVKKVRALGGFEDFLRPKSFSVLSAAAVKGPVVILIASGLNRECHALVMTSSRGPTHIPLTQIRDRTVEQLSKRLYTLLGSSLRLTRSSEGRHMHRMHPNDGSLESVIKKDLGTLWETVVRPVLNHLEIKKSDCPPRLWWLPTGPFALLPLHAAGFYDSPISDCAGDYVISSYTPTLSALLALPPTISDTYKVLAAIQPVTSGHDQLPFTRDEIQKIEDHISSQHLVKLGARGAPTTIRNVLLEIVSASIFHFAGHGVQDVKNPLNSALILGDGRLEVSQLMPLAMENAALVFLSACQTAKVDEKLPDEAIHLAATMMFAGFRGAIGTMWSIQDCDGPAVADSFYRHLFALSGSESTDGFQTAPDTTHAARALHLAVFELRDRLRADNCPSWFERWVPFIHMGL